MANFLIAYSWIELSKESHPIHNYASHRLRFLKSNFEENILLYLSASYN